MRGRSASDDEQGDGVVHGAGDTADSIHQARTLGHDHRRDAACLAEVRIRHMDGVRFMLGLNALDLGVVNKSVENRPDRSSRVSEVVGYAGSGKPVGECINNAHPSVLLCFVFFVHRVSNKSCCQI